MKYLRHKTKLYPNDQAVDYLNKACGTARFAYNWGLSRWQEDYKAGNKPTAYTIRNTFNNIREEQFPWTYEVSKWASQTGFENLGNAFKRFFKKQSKYPKFKKKGQCRDSFTLGIDTLIIRDNKLKLPNFGYVRMADPIRFKGKAKSATISRCGSNWYVSILVEIEQPYVHSFICKSQASVGIDLGISNLATLSDGAVIPNITSYKNLERKLGMAQKAVSRKVKGSRNREKAKLLVANIHHKIANKRNTHLNQATTFICKNYKNIVIEDLQVCNMVKNRKLSKAISDVAWGEFRRQIEYKSVLAGNTVTIATKFYASSKLCSGCGYKNTELKLSDREWICPDCGMVHDRDINAANNLLALVAEDFPDTINACGDSVSLEDCSNTAREHESMKQEITLSFEGQV